MMSLLPHPRECYSHISSTERHHLEAIHSADDAKWFSERPARHHRVRRAYRGEAIAGAWIFVRQIRPGVRIRLGAGCAVDPDEIERRSESFAARLWRELARETYVGDPPRPILELIEETFA